MKRQTIKNNHPARKQMGKLPNYFETKTEAIHAIETILNEYGMELDWNGQFDISNDEGSRTFDIVPSESCKTYCDNCGKDIEVVGYNNLVSFSWYRMGSGRWEIVSYIS